MRLVYNQLTEEDWCVLSLAKQLTIYLKNSNTEILSVSICLGLKHLFSTEK